MASFHELLGIVGFDEKEIRAIVDDVKFTNSTRLKTMSGMFIHEAVTQAGLQHFHTSQLMA